MRDPDFNKLSFSQREGKAPLPDPLRLEYLPQDFRNRVWRTMDWWIQNHPSTMGKVVIEYTVSILQMPHDSMEHTPRNHWELLRNTVLEGEYHEVLSLVEFVVRSSIPLGIQRALIRVFKAVPVAYSVETMNDTPTIVSRSSMESGAATEQAIKSIENKDRKGQRLISEMRLMPLTRNGMQMP